MAPEKVTDNYAELFWIGPTLISTVTLQTEQALPHSWPSEHIAECFARGMAGDVPAYRSFLEQLTDLLKTYFRKRFGDTSEVDDLIQEAMLAIHHRRHTFSNQVPITAWIHAIARYKSADWLSEKKRHTSLFEPLGDMDAPAADPIAAWQANWDIRLLLDSLPDKQRQSIEFVKLYGFSVAEAAIAMGMSEGAIKVSVHRGLKAMGHMLSGANFEPRSA